MVQGRGAGDLKLNAMKLFGVSTSHAAGPSYTGRYSHLEENDASRLCIRLCTPGHSCELIKSHSDRRRPRTGYRVMHMQLYEKRIGLCPKMVMLVSYRTFCDGRSYMRKSNNPSNTASSSSISPGRIATQSQNRHTPTYLHASHPQPF